MIIDPERTVDPDDMIREIVPDSERGSARQRVLLWGGIVAAMLLLAAGWRWTPLDQWLSPASLAATIGAVRESAAAPLWIVLAYVAGGLMVFPVTALVVATAIAFTPAIGFAYALAGVLASALVTYAFGAALGRMAVRRLAGSRLHRISRRRGLLAIIFVRVVPIAPFSVINLVAGASHIRLRDYLLGTLIGMTPGIAAVALLADRIEAIVRSPDAGNVALFAAALILLALAVFGLHQWLARSARLRKTQDVTN